jgi:hypothetical protein
MREQSVGKQRQPTKAQPQDPRAPDATETGCLNLRWCFALLDGLAAAGLDLLVLSPGSRSTPVVLAAQRHLGLDIVPILDERSAAFFALGAARASGRPAALLATSGSAPAHWYPAVIEASEAGVPLILLSADRPPRMRNWGANQTIDQIRLFGAFVRESHDPGLPRQQAAAIKAVRALGLRAGSISLGPNLDRYTSICPLMSRWCRRVIVKQMRACQCQQAPRQRRTIQHLASLSMPDLAVQSGSRGRVQPFSCQLVWD